MLPMMRNGAYTFTSSHPSKIYPASAGAFEDLSKKSVGSDKPSYSFDPFDALKSVSTI